MVVSIIRHLINIWTPFLSQVSDTKWGNFCVHHLIFLQKICYKN
jgi:hypothetical protein